MKRLTQIQKIVKNQANVEIRTTKGDVLVYPTTKQDNWLPKEKKQNQCTLPEKFVDLYKVRAGEILGE